MVLDKRRGQHTYPVQVKDGKFRAGHGSQLKRGVEDPSGRPMPQYFTTGLMSGRRENDEWEVEEVVKHRRTRDGRLEFLVKWQGVDAAENP